MLIRSQDKKLLVNLENARCLSNSGYIKKGGEYYRNPSFKDNCHIVKADELMLGEYSTEEKAIEVLDMIQKEYTKAYFGPGGKDALTGEMFQPFGFIPPKVFQMPTDEEVEG